MNVMKLSKENMNVREGKNGSNQEAQQRRNSIQEQASSTGYSENSRGTNKTVDEKNLNMMNKKIRKIKRNRRGRGKQKRLKNFTLIY